MAIPVTQDARPPLRGRRMLAGALCASAPLYLLVSVTPNRQPEVELRLLPALVLDSAEESPAAVWFSHDTHAAYVENRCLTCHPRPFSILGRGAPIRHDDMNEGRSCGACHNGRDATAVDDVEACLSCHTGRDPVPADQGSVAASVARDVTFAAGAASPGAVTFRHAPHGSACRDCHPALFEMRAGATPLDKAAMAEGATCGRCHEGTVAFAVDDGDRCQTCHAMGGSEP